MRSCSLAPWLTKTVIRSLLRWFGWFPPDSGDFDVLAGTVADASGNFSISVPPGNYELLGSAPEYLADLSAPTISFLPSGTTNFVNVSLDYSPGTIYGQLVDAAIRILCCRGY